MTSQHPIALPAIILIVAFAYWLYYEYRHPQKEVEDPSEDSWD